MRVEVVEKIATPSKAATEAAGDASASLAVKNFLAAIDSDDSLFCVAQPLAGPSPEEAAAGSIYSGDMILEFREAEHCRQRSLHFLLLEKLIELLKGAGSQESLEAALCLTSGTIPAGGSLNAPSSEGLPIQKVMALWIKLAAKGDSADQAVLRWGLGLAHLQQAILFTSRHLRLHLTQTRS
ncbi:MAG: hypothetical protein WA829_14420 [Candidatus Acidiferrum sp.]